jgi:hypothetical protein
MLQAPPALVLDLLEWIAKEPRRYSDVIDVWRTSCPRLPVWEDDVHEGYVRRESSDDGGVVEKVTPRGEDFLRENGRTAGP